MVDGDVKPLAIADLLHQVGQIEHAELLGELVEDPVLALCRRALDGDLDAPQRVANIQEAAGLATLAINGKRASQRGLHAIPVQDGAPDAVVIETRGQTVIKLRFVGLQPVHDSLVEVGGTNSPNLTGKHDVVRIVNLGKVIEGSGLLGEGEQILATVVVNL